jgi:hypothetical protein
VEEELQRSVAILAILAILATETLGLRLSRALM